GTGTTLREYQRNIIDFERSQFTNLIPDVSDESITELSTFLQWFQPIGNKINLLFGSQFLRRENGDFANSINTINPRLAILYKFDESVQLRASFSTALRAPTPFYNATTYTYSPVNYESLKTGLNMLDAERTRSFETGLRWYFSSKVDLDLSFSYTRTDNFINYNIVFAGMGMQAREGAFTLGYFNDENSEAELIDLQMYLRMRNIVPSIKLGATLNVNFANGQETLTTTNIGDFINEVRVLDDLRAHPTANMRFSIYATPFRDVLIRFDQYFVSSTLTRNSLRLNAPMNMPLLNQNNYIDGFYSADVSINYNINRNFLLYGKLINIFNEEYAGIDASSSNDILGYNPQSLSIFRLGLNYEFN
ncbi:MAG: TonB-dependent receptor, partial [Bacteroidota bacterium]